MQDVLIQSAQRELYANVQANGTGGPLNSIGSASFPSGNEVLAVLLNAANFSVAKSVLGV